MVLFRMNARTWCALGYSLAFAGVVSHADCARAATSDVNAGTTFTDGTYDGSTFNKSNSIHVWDIKDYAVLVGKSAYTGDTLVEHGTLELGNADRDGNLSADTNIYLPEKNSSISINNSYQTDLNQNVAGRGSIIFKGTGSTNVTGNIILMNPNPNKNANKVGNTSGGKAAFPTGVEDKPLSGDIVIRSGEVHILGSGYNTGDIEFYADEENSLSGRALDKNSHELLGNVDSSGILTAAGSNQEEKDLNKLRLQGFVVNNDYVIIGQADRGNLIVSNGAVLGTDTSTVNVGLAASARGSTLTVDNAWLHAGILAVGNGDSTYDPPMYDNSQIPTQDNGTLNVQNGGVINSIVTVAGNYLGSIGGIHVSGTADPVNRSYASQSTLAATNFFVNGSGAGVVDVGDGTNVNSGLIAVKNSIAFGVPSKDDLIGANKNDQVVQGQLQKKNGTLNINTGGTVSVSNPRDSSGNIVSDAIYIADNEKYYQFNLNGGILQRGTYNDIASGMSPLRTAININISKDSFMDSNKGNIYLDGVLFGSGGFTKINQGKVVLSNHNTFSGDVLVQQGGVELVSKNGIVGNLGNAHYAHLQNTDSSLIVNSSLDTTVGQTIDGKGNFEQVGTGMTVLTGDNSYTGETTVERGHLRINGNQSQAMGHTTVMSGAKLSGTGTVGGSVVVNDGGVISAGVGDGNRHESLTISGSGDTNQKNLTIEKGGIIDAHIGSDQLSQDKRVNNYVYHEGNVIYVTGKASFGEGSIINLSAAPGTLLRYGVGYRVVQTTNGVEGDLSKVKTTVNHLFLDQQVGYEGDGNFNTIVDENGNLIPAGQNNPSAVDVILRRNSTQYQDIANTRNENEVAHALDHMGNVSNMENAFAQMTDKGEARNALNALSGEIHASMRSALIQNSFYTRQAIVDRLATADCEGVTSGGVINTADWQTHRRIDGQCVSDRAIWWGQAYGGMGHTESTFGTAGMSSSVAGFIIGADKPLEDGWRVGGMVGYAHSMMQVKGRASSGRSDDISVGAYASKQWGPLALRAGATYTWNIMNTNRRVDYGAFHDKDTSQRSGGTAQAFSEIAYRFHPGEQTRIEPFVNMAYVNLNTRNFKENGGQAALRSLGMNTGVGFVTTGARVSTRFWVGDTMITPYAMAAYRHAFGDITPTAHHNFAIGSDDMDVNGAPLSEDTAVVDAGVHVQLTDMIDVELSYLGQYGNRGYDNSGRANLRVRF